MVGAYCKGTGENNITCQWGQSRHPGLSGILKALIVSASCF